MRCKTEMQFLLLIYLASILAVSGYRLNVPRVLLPYHPTQQIQFLLEISHPEGGCFNWRSSRPTIVAIEPINPRKNGCSDKAMITSKSKLPNEENAVIFAENHDEGVSFLCDVTVDAIQKIDITTTAKVLFMDAAPARMIVEAMNAEGDRFSTLGTIPFEWRFSNLSENSLRIVPFSQSNYDAPPGIEELEKQRKQGFVVLVEGLLTGSAVLSAKFAEKEYEHIEPSGIELFAVANVMLVPSQDLYLPINAIIPYKAMAIRKDHDEEITLPSPHYSIEISNPAVCEFDVKESKVTAKALGNTEITLIDSTGVEKLKGIVKPRSARLYVVEPSKIRFNIDGNNWYLQKNNLYKVTIQLLDSVDNVLYIPENAVFSVKMPPLFKVQQKSRDNTYFEVKAVEIGNGVIKAAFESLFAKDGKVLRADPIVLGEQRLTISDPVIVNPKVLVFPYHEGKNYEYQLKASGGTGRYKWSSSGESVAGVDQINGILRTGNTQGDCSICARDFANMEHQDSAKTFVVEPYSLQFGPSSVSAVVGSKLVLNLKMLGQTSAGFLPFTDCRYVPFKFDIEDENIFLLDESAQTTLPLSGSGCATVTVMARSPGETRFVASFNHLRAEIDITSTVDLTGIRIIASSVNVETGSLVSAQIHGISKDGEFAFDNGIYPFDVHWKLSNSASDVAIIKSPLADFIDESPRNCFSINIQTMNSGTITVYATAILDKDFERNFYGKSRKLTASVQIIVEDSMQLRSPPLSSGMILMGPSSNLELVVNRRNARVSVPPQYASLITVSQDAKVNTLHSSSKEGNGVVDIQDLNTNKSKLVHVEVLPVQSIHLRSEIAEVSPNFGVSFLPKNSKVQFLVEFRDALGRLMHSASNQISYRFHRTDVIDAKSSKGNRKIEVQLKQTGDTVFKVWDTNNKKLSTFLRISIGEPYTSTPLPTTQKKQEPKIMSQTKQGMNKLPEQREVKSDKNEPKPVSIKDILGRFFDRYNNFVLSVFAVILATMLIVAGIRMGGFNEPQFARAKTPTHISEISSIIDESRSSLQDARIARRGHFSTDRPLFHSTPGTGPTPTGGDNAGEFQPKTRQLRNMGRDRQEEEPSSIRNISSNSVGSAEDPYRWTTNDSMEGSLVNRHYK